ncbi:unnamed protein product [Brachionus calyciflorus]|uniref:Uncharacterized protein n=1 Tax=Brachionus calyciflorus TaxID=104777 RepID=A0A813X992_9BILA|nr:unnamed protein product [Brachionus calyciflorus]
MNHPVLLPKRKDFGFLKAPQEKLNFKSSSSVHRYTPGRRQEFITETCKPISLSQSINTLKLKYEFKSASLTRPFVTVSENFSSGVKLDLRKDHFDRQAYSTNKGSNVRNLKKQHHMINVYSINAKKPKTADSIRIQNGKYISKLNEMEVGNENDYHKTDCISCRFGKCLKLNQLVALRGVKKPLVVNDEYDRIRTTESLHTIDYGSKTPNNRSSEFSDYMTSGKRSRKSGMSSSLPHKKNNDETFSLHSVYRHKIEGNFDDEDDDDDVIPKLTLWLV